MMIGGTQVRERAYTHPPTHTHIYIYIKNYYFLILQPQANCCINMILKTKMIQYEGFYYLDI